MLETLVILGGGGWFPAHGRHTASALLLGGEEAVMIDAGTGVGRLMERPELLAGVRKLDILLTHFHLDHVAGLAYLPAVVACEQTTIWGPGELLYGRATGELLEQVSHEPFHPVPMEAQDIAVRDLPAQGLELAGTRIRLRHQGRHSAPTLGFRFGDALTWITDTARDEQSVRFAAGSALLAHEAWFTEATPRNPQIHSSARQAALIAGEAGVDRLLLTHLPPFERELEAVVAEAQEGFGEVSLAGEGETIALGRP